MIADDNRPGRPISVSTPENMDAIHNMILSDRRIGIKQSYIRDTKNLM